MEIKAREETREQVWLEVDAGGRRKGRLVVQLLWEDCPKTCENFRCLCTGDDKRLQGLSLKGTTFHRLVPGYAMYGGDLANGDGSGEGKSIYGPTFEDEEFVKVGKHEGKGTLSMVNKGPDTNGSQFMITFAATPDVDGKQIVFGKVIKGQELLGKLQKEIKTDGFDKPSTPIRIVNCGQEGDLVKKTIVEKLERISEKRERERNYLNKVSEGMNFPVPTPNNPTATYISTEARDTAQAKIDEQNASEFEKVKNITGKVGARKRKLLELRKRQAKARSENQQSVIEEHRRSTQQLSKSKSKEERDLEKEKQLREEKEKNMRLELLGASGSESYLLETAESAAHSNRKRKQKAINAIAAMDAHRTNQDTLFRSYNKSIKDLESHPKLDQNELHNEDDDDNDDGDDDVSEAAKERLVNVLQAQEAKREKKFKKRRVRLEEDNVDAINSANERFNEKIEKAFGKYTVEVKQNFERGTAL